MRPLTTDLSREAHRPYFFWDRDVTIAELHEALRGPDSWERDRLLGTMLREARDMGVAL